MNLDLLKPFDREAAKRGEEICWSDNTETLKLIAEAGSDGEYALKRDDGNNYLAGGIQLRMKPLAWVEDRPVYKGDKLWHETGVWITADRPTGKGNFIAADGDETLPACCTWTKPAPVKKTRTVKFLGYMRGDGRLVLLDESKRVLYKRVPGADVTYEVEE